MDSIFGIGPMELALILIIAGLVMGPERMVQTARWLGQKVSEMQAISHNLRNQLDREIAALDKDGGVRTAVDELHQIGQQLQHEVASTRQQISQPLASPTIAPPRQPIPETLETPITPSAPPPPRVRPVADDPE